MGEEAEDLMESMGSHEHTRERERWRRGRKEERSQSAGVGGCRLSVVAVATVAWAAAGERRRAGPCKASDVG